MSAGAFQDFAAETQRVRNALARHARPAYIVGFDVEFGDTWDGDPGVWVYLRLAEDGRPTSEQLDEMSRLIDLFLTDMYRLYSDRTPFVRFRVQQPQAS